MLNRIALVGRLTKDPELRRTGNGTAVTSFNLAVNRTFANQEGERQADFIPCVVWKKGAENVAKYCAKGSLVGIDGRLQSRTYQDNNGNNRTVIEVICDSVQFLETKKEAQQQTQQQDNVSYQDTPYYNFDILDDDLQF